MSGLLDEYSGLIYGLCLKYLKDQDTAKDAVMDIFEKLIIKLKTEEIQHFKSWLYIVSKNHCLMELRKKGLEYSSDNMELPSSVHLNEEDSLEQDLVALEECIEELKFDQKECVKAFFLARKSYQTIALDTGYELKKIKSYIQNGKRNLKNCLEKKNVRR